MFNLFGWLSCKVLITEQNNVATVLLLLLFTFSACVRGGVPGQFKGSPSAILVKIQKQVKSWKFVIKNYFTLES